MAKRKSLPDNPAALFGSTASDKPTGKETETAKKSDGGRTTSTLKTKEGEDGIVRARVTADVPVEIAEAARNAVYFTPGMTLRDLLADALEREVQRMEKERGEPFPQRGKELKRGRRA